MAEIISISDDALIKYKPDQFLKKSQAGHTFYSFIANDSVYVIGYIKDFVYLKNSSDLHVLEKTYEDCKVIMYISEYKFPVWKIIPPNGYIPISVSANKFNLAILLMKKNNKNLVLEDYKEFKELFIEIKNNFKSKNTNFQSYFLDSLTNEVLYNKGPINDEYRYFILESEFKEKLNDIVINSNNEKFINQSKRFVEKLRLNGVANSGKLDVYELHQIVYNHIYPNTKIIIIGEFIKTFKNQIKTIEIKDCFDTIYRNTLLVETPLILLPIKQVEIGENHVLMLTMEGELYSYGDGQGGVTGNGILKFHCKPSKVNLPYNNICIIRIAVGSRHNLAVDSNLIIYSWGYGKNGRLGNDSENNQIYPKTIESLSNSKIIYCSAGDNYSCAISQSSILYTWGCGEFGRLGHEGNEDQLIPKPLEEKDNFFVVAYCNYYCLVAITNKNEALFYGSKSLFINDLKIKDNVDTNLILTDISDNKKKLEFNNSKNIKLEIVYISSGYQFIACITKDKKELSYNTIDKQINQDKLENSTFENNLYIWGNINMIASDYKSYFSKWYEISKENIDKINEKDAQLMNYQSKLFETKIRTAFDKDEKEVLINDKAKLIQSTKEKNRKAKEMRKHKLEVAKEIVKNDLKEINFNLSKYYYNEGKHNAASNKLGAKKVICSDNNTTVLSNDGNVYCFGSYLYKLANDKIDHFYIPIQPRGIKVDHIGVGANHMLIVTTNYEVYGKGKNKEGQLGLGNSNMLIDNFKLIEKLKNKGIKKAYCNDNYSAVLSYNNELYLFGDISFIENSKHINYQLTPKEMDWGQVYKVALGISHILFISKDKYERVYLKSIGNGTYGKLGDGNEFEDNRYEPVVVDIAFPNSFKEDDKWQLVTIKCSKNTSAAIIAERSKKKVVYMWGLCFKTIFNERDLERLYDNKPKISRNIKEDMIIQNKPVQASIWEEVDKLYLSDTSIYAITPIKNEVKSIGNFFTVINNKLGNVKYNLSNDYDCLSIGLDHAAGITFPDMKVYTWGFDIMNKLGIQNKENSFTSYEDYDSCNKFLVTNATSILELNKLFKDNLQLGDNANIIISNNEKTELKDKIEDTNYENINLDKKEIELLADNIFVQTQKNINTNYKYLESELKQKESDFKEDIKKIVQKYHFLVDKEVQASSIKKVLYNNFNFKYGDNPINVQFKSKPSYKIPKEYLKYEPLYEALLTTLKIHPCYLVKIFEKKLLSDTEYYDIVNGLYDNLFNNNYCQSLLITLISKLFEIDFKNEKDKLDNLNKDLMDNEPKDIFESYKFFRIEHGNLEFSLLGLLCKRFLELQKDLMRRLENIAIFLVSQIYQKIGSKGSNSNIENAMTISFNPRYRSKENISDVMTTLINGRIEMLHNIVDNFVKYIQLDASDNDTFKDTLFSHNKLKYGPLPNESGLIIKLNEMILLLIQEIKKSMIKAMGSKFKQKIDEWIIKNFPILIFSQMLHIIEDPEKRLIVDASVLIDKSSYSSFIKKSINNFYSLSLSLKTLFISHSGDDSAGENDIINKLTKKLSDLKFRLNKGLKTIFETGEDKLLNNSIRLDIIKLKSFFNNSLCDNINVINFSLHKLKRLHEIIPENIDDLRVLSKDYDLLDKIFFNKNPNLYLGNENGLINFSIGIDDDTYVQVNLKTRMLSCVKPKTIMRCSICESFLIDEFNLANEKIFFDEFEFYSNSSKEYLMLHVLKALPIIKNDKILEFIKDELRKEENIEIKEALGYLCTAIGIEQKNTLLLQEDDLANTNKLIDIILSDKATLSKLFEYCKNINTKVEDMNIHKNYYTLLSKNLKNIKDKVSDDALSELTFKSSLYDVLKKNLEKGTGNPDLIKMVNTLDGSSVIANLVKFSNNYSKGKIINKKLGIINSSKILPFKEYELKKLIREKVILSVLLEDCNADKK